MSKYIRVGRTDFDKEFVNGLTFEEIEKRYSYLHPKVVAELLKQLGKKKKTKKTKKSEQ